ncbi:ribosomal-processing cysteine protease Prp [Alicyclobacillus curvatus]|nr:ribosomal-processing cysteine protease Prp [Alicyclobacillus curvatus]
MIRFRVYQADNRICEFVVTGHAGYGEAGTDIVCAGVSALVYNAVNSCERLLGIVLDTTDTGNKLHCVVPSKQLLNSDVQLLLHSLVFGVEQVAEAYPEYVKVEHRIGTE